MPTDYRCPECTALGMTPRRIWGEHSYDAKGQYHPHGQASSVAEYHCSNGHVWTVDTRDDCVHCQGEEASHAK